MIWTMLSQPPVIEEFEQEIADYIGKDYAVAFNSGTSALHAALLAYGIREGDEIIVPSFTFISTANAPLFVGAKPVFAEIEDATYGLDADDVAEKITKKTKAIIPIHYGGCPCSEIEALRNLAEDNDLLLIEDAAESFGAMVKNQKVGTYGDAAMFSFCQNKIIATGEGGAIVTDSPKVYKKLKLICSHGRQENDSYFSSGKSSEYVALGYNFRMPSISAALGLSQLKKIDRLIRLRQEHAQYYTSNLKHLVGVYPPRIPTEFYHVFQMYTIRVSKDLRDNLIKFLAKKGIFSKVYFPPVHLTKFYQNKYGYRKGYLQLTESIANQVLTLPMFPALEKSELSYITSTINEFFEV